MLISAVSKQQVLNEKVAENFIFNIKQILLFSILRKDDLLFSLF